MPDRSVWGAGGDWLAAPPICPAALPIGALSGRPAGPSGWLPDGDTPDDSPLFWLSMAVPPRAGPSLGIPGGTL
ncbi:hypothetical protein D7I43_08800 [Micromonospora globbae]|uniref:Uncharacterized protein n=1 Tax=Micromonospora globbae TaxID=1894969 RepID=A0A420F4C6_9ACTN|nr:hypothetical protein D7I43_08800 [Micromonospora globbae]